jgi:peroxiredoxin
MQTFPIRIHARRRLVARALAAIVLGLLAAGPVSAADDHDHDHRHENALPRFEGKTLAGGQASTDLLQKRRGLIYVFASSDPDAERVAALVESVAAEAAAANVVILGIARDPNPDLSKHFAKLHGFEFPVIGDREGTISQKLRVPPATSSLLVVDAEGYVIGGIGGLARQPKENDPTAEDGLRRLLNLGVKSKAATPTLGVRPKAPPFDVVGLDGKTRITLAELSGKVVVFLFFLPTCPHCHDVLKHLDGLQ